MQEKIGVHKINKQKPINPINNSTKKNKIGKNLTEEVKEMIDD
jgi:hypothetical protein